MRTVASVGATRATARRTASSPGLVPTNGDESGVMTALFRTASTVSWWARPAEPEAGARATAAGRPRSRFGLRPRSLRLRTPAGSARFDRRRPGHRLDGDGAHR